MTTIPPGLAEALGHMQRAVACPEEVKARIAALRVPVDEVAGTRGLATNWRISGGGGHSGGHPGGHSGGHSGGHPGGHSGGGGGGGHSGSGGGGWQNRSNGYRGGGSGGGWRPRNDAPPQQHAPPRRPYADRAAMPRFGNKANKEATTEDRMMDRIRDKMNKFSSLTYDATKTWLSQLLDSGETDFLTGFIELVFEKAASEATFTVLYARLITELRASFGHLDTEMRRIFDAFMSVFAVAAGEPDAGSAEYATYLALRERRKFRRGYACFIAEITRLGVLTSVDILRTCSIVLDGLDAARVADGQQQLCEEYADCLGSLLKGCKDIVRADIGALLPRIRAAMDRATGPSLSNKARFALMDLVELFI